MFIEYNNNRKNQKVFNAKQILEDEIARMGKANKLQNRDEADIIKEQKQKDAPKGKFNFPQKKSQVEDNYDNKDINAYQGIKSKPGSLDNSRDESGSQSKDEEEDQGGNPMMFMRNAVNRVQGAPGIDPRLQMLGGGLQARGGNNVSGIDKSKSIFFVKKCINVLQILRSCLVE